MHDRDNTLFAMRECEMESRRVDRAMNIFLIKDLPYVNIFRKKKINVLEITATSGIINAYVMKNDLKSL